MNKQEDNHYHLILESNTGKKYEIASMNIQETAMGIKAVLDCMKAGNFLNKTITDIRIEVR